MTNNLYNLLNLNLIRLDAPTPWGIFFQDSASVQMEGIEELHNNIFFYLTIIYFVVLWMMVSIIKTFIEKNNPISYKYMNHGTLVELIWTITPAVILILIAFPSFKLLYLMDEVLDPSLVVHAEGLYLGGLKLCLFILFFFSAVLTFIVIIHSDYVLSCQIHKKLSVKKTKKY